MDGPLKVGTLYRELQDVELSIRKDGGTTTINFSGSSEYPVDRFFGTEILSHAPGAIRLDRANSGAVPLLFNHDRNDPVGMVSKGGVRVANGRTQVAATFFDTARAQEVAKMVDGGMRNVSGGYRMHTVSEDTKTNTYTATDWEPMEYSIAPIPADPTVGIGRSAGDDPIEVTVTRQQPQGVAPAIPAIPKQEQRNMEQQQQQGPAGGTAPQDAGKHPEQLRVVGLINLCRAHKIEDSQRDAWIAEGIGIDEASQKVLETIATRANAAPKPVTDLDMSAKETRRYSMWRAIRAVADGNWKDAGLEAEATREIGKRLNRLVDANSFFVPFDIQKREVPVMTRNGVALTTRDLSVAASGGGYLVETSNMGFIELMRNRSVVMRMGATRLPGLVGNVNIPKQSAAATAYWLTSETNQITESQQTLVQVPLSPKTAGAYTEISRQLLLQSAPEAEGLVTADLSAVVALAVDQAAINGGGGATPQGIIGTSGVGSVSGTALAYAGVIEFQTDVATANVMPVRGGYVATPAVAGILMAKARFANTDTPLWDGSVWDATMAGFPAMSSMQVPTGDCLFGDWSQVVIAEWGVLEIAVNPVANFQAGIIGVRAMYSVDVAVRIPVAFSLATSVTA